MFKKLTFLSPISHSSRVTYRKIFSPFQISTHRLIQPLSKCNSLGNNAKEEDKTILDNKTERKITLNPKSLKEFISVKNFSISKEKFMKYLMLDNSEKFSVKTNPKDVKGKSIKHNKKIKNIQSQHLLNIHSFISSDNENKSKYILGDNTIIIHNKNDINIPIQGSKHIKHKNTVINMKNHTYKDKFKNSKQHLSYDNMLYLLRNHKNNVSYYTIRNHGNICNSSTNNDIKSKHGQKICYKPNLHLILKRQILKEERNLSSNLSKIHRTTLSDEHYLKVSTSKLEIPYLKLLQIYRKRK